MGFITEYKRRRARGDKMRPIWQIVILVPAYLIYIPARWYVDLLDGA